MGRPIMLAAKSRPVQTLCYGCLSADRDLSPIGEFSDMFMMICDRKARVPGLKYTSLCWECTATLKRIQLFHKQVNSAQTILKFYLSTEDLQKPLPKTLSRLKATKTNHDFLSLIESVKSEIDIKPLDETKEEEDHDEDKELICSVEPYEPKVDIKLLDKFKDVTDYDRNDDFNQGDDVDFSDDNNEEEHIKQDPSFIVELKDLNARKPINMYKNRLYCRINTAKEMCVKEQARPSDLVNLWDSVQGSSMCQETVYRCLVCGHRSPSMEAAGQHVTQHKNIVKCRRCEFCCMGPAVARSHHKIAHTQFLCDYCGKRCLSKQFIQKHISRKHTENKCEHCPRTFPDYNRLQLHLTRVHDKVDPSGEAFCVKCNKHFKNRARLNHHLRFTVIHAEENGKEKQRVKCLACDKTFSRRLHMMEHVRSVHLGTRKRLYCSICDKNFCRTKGYRDHMRYKHEGRERPRNRICGVCGRGFSSFCKKSGYRDHMRYKHEGLEKPRNRICSVCGRGFSQNHTLDNHMRTHTGERPFACAVCDARFAQKVARDMHQKRHCRQNKAD